MRASGVLLHISSLPSRHGIGALGDSASEFIDFLAAAGQSFWQILPIGPTSYGDSPYQCFSTHAGNPYFIDLDLLQRQGLLEREWYEQTAWGGEADRVDYQALYSRRFTVLRRAYERFTQTDCADYDEFCRKQRSWLEPYALFMALKKTHGDSSWLDWPAPLRDRRQEAQYDFSLQRADEVDFWKFIQYIFQKQWIQLRRYAAQKGVQIIGDMPLYVALDSADVWSNRELFQLDDDGYPTAIAGTPPDYFSKSGQLWGNPVYNWPAHKKQRYGWWIERMRRQTEWFDRIRLDHFLGIINYYAIPPGDADAKRGSWNKGPGRELFDALMQSLEPLDLIAEDLGVITKPVEQLRDELGLPGMRVVQFAFSDRDPDNVHMPHNIPQHSVVYAGTHDNPTTRSWWTGLPMKSKISLMKYFGFVLPFFMVRRILSAVMATKAELSIITMQDLLYLDDRARMNRPGVLAGNWQWRMKNNKLYGRLAARLRAMTKKCNRLGSG